MKKVCMIILLLQQLSCFAQKTEFSINLGANIDSKPSGNMYYKGEGISYNYYISMAYLSNWAHNWQVGLEFDALQLARKSGKNYLTPWADGEISSGKTLIYSRFTPTLGIVVNKKFKLGAHSNVFLGFFAGAGNAENSDKKLNDKIGYVAPDGGIGPCLGGQLGYVHQLNKRFSFTAVLAARYYSLFYDAHAANYTPYSYLHYDIAAFCGSVGLRYSFLGRASKHNVNNQYDEKANAAKIDTVQLSLVPAVDTSVENKSIAVNQKDGNGSEKNIVNQPGVSGTGNSGARESSKSDNRNEQNQNIAIRHSITISAYATKKEAEKNKLKIEKALNTSVTVTQVGIDYVIEILNIETLTRAGYYVTGLKKIGYNNVFMR